MSNRLKTVGHLYKKQLENRLSKSTMFNDTAKEKACGIFFVTGFWWKLVNPPSRALKTPCGGVFARRDAKRRARAVQIHQRNLLYS